MQDIIFTITQFLKQTDALNLISTCREFNNIPYIVTIDATEDTYFPKLQYREIRKNITSDINYPGRKELEQIASYSSYIWLDCSYWYEKEIVINFKQQVFNVYLCASNIPIIIEANIIGLDIDTCSNRTNITIINSYNSLKKITVIRTFESVNFNLQNCDKVIFYYNMATIKHLDFDNRQFHFANIHPQLIDMFDKKHIKYSYDTVIINVQSVKEMYKFFKLKYSGYNIIFDTFEFRDKSSIIEKCFISLKKINTNNLTIETTYLLLKIKIIDSVIGKLNIYGTTIPLTKIYLENCKFDEIDIGQDIKNIELQNTTITLFKLTAYPTALIKKISMFQCKINTLIYFPDTIQQIHSFNTTINTSIIKFNMYKPHISYKCFCVSQEIKLIFIGNLDATRYLSIYFFSNNTIEILKIIQPLTNINIFSTNSIKKLCISQNCDKIIMFQKKEIDEYYNKILDASYLYNVYVKK